MTLIGCRIIKSFLTHLKSSKPSWLVGIPMILADGLELKRPVDWPRILLIHVTFELLRRNIKIYNNGLLRLLLVESPGQSYVATSSYYRRQLVNRRMYPSVWSQNCLCLLIEKATAMAVKVMIEAPNFAEVIVDVIVYLPVVANNNTLYPQNVLLLCYFLWIRRSPFYLQTSGPTKMPNSK